MHGMKEMKVLHLNFFKMYLPLNLFGIHKQAPLQLLPIISIFRAV